MNQTIASEPAAGIRPAPGLSGLLSSEILRARSRRSLGWMVLGGVLALLAVVAIVFASTAAVTQEDLDEAAARYLAEQEAYYQQCMGDSTIPEQEKTGACWKPTPEDAVNSALWNLPRQPFLASDMEGLISFGGGIGILIALMVAASAGGADWGARTMGLLLSWEPRRLRVFLVRLSVVMVLGVGIVFVLVGLALGLGHVLVQLHGPVGDIPGLEVSGAEPSDAGKAIGTALRWLPLGGLGAAAGFAVAMATRSTGWAIGAAIGFVTIVETVIALVWPWSRQWLIQTNIQAWLSGGISVAVDPDAPNQMEGSLHASDTYVQPGTIMLSDTRAILTLTGMCLLLLLVSALLLRSRDVD